MAAAESNRGGDLLESLVPLNLLPARGRNEVLQRSTVLELARGDHVFREGKRDDYVYYLLEGELELWGEAGRRERVVAGSERACQPLAELQPRRLSARAVGAARVLRVDRETLERLTVALGEQAVSVNAIEEDDDGDWMTRMLQSELFARVPTANIQRIFACMEAVELDAGAEVVKQGSVGDYYYIVQSGRCEVVRRSPATSKPVRLAELGPGDGFGEEALVAGARRNASVVMLTKGELMRLAQPDFAELIQAPLLEGIDRDEAAARVAEGAVWLDVRFAEEHAESGIEGSVNVPLNTLRIRITALPRDRQYLVYCDDGRRSAVGAFLLSERGFQASYVVGGMTGGAAAAPGPATAQASSGAVLAFPPPAAGPIPASQLTETEKDAGGPGPQATPSGPIPASQLSEAEKSAAGARAGAEAEPNDALMQADVAAEALRAELAGANADLERAEQARARAEAARREAEQQAQVQVRAEREKLEQEAERARAAVEEAQRLRGEIAEAKRRADETVTRHREEQDERIRRLEQQARRRLEQERRKLEEAYRAKQAELEEAHRLKAEAEQALRAERQRLAAQASEARRRLGEARRVEREVEQARVAAAEEAERRHAQQQALEERLRQELRTRVEDERRKLEAEFARNAEQLEMARREKAAAEEVRRAAAQEAEQIIAEYKAAHERMRAAEEAKLEAERERLAAEARVIEQRLHEAERLKAEAREGRQAAEQDVERLERGGAAAGALEAAQEELREASAECARAERDHEAATAARDAHAEQMRRHEDQADELRVHAEQEVEQWRREADAREQSELQQEILAHQRVHLERIMRRAEDARREARERDKHLLEDLAARLAGRDPEED